MKKKILLGVLLFAPVFLSSTHKNRGNKRSKAVVDNELQKKISEFIGIMRTPLRVFWTSKETRAYYQGIVNEIDRKNKNKNNLYC